MSDIPEAVGEAVLTEARFDNALMHMRSISDHFTEGTSAKFFECPMCAESCKEVVAFIESVHATLTDALSGEYVRVPREALTEWIGDAPVGDINDGIAWLAARLLREYGGDQPTPTVCPCCGWPTNRESEECDGQAICPVCQRMRNTYHSDEGTSGFVPPDVCPTCGGSGLAWVPTSIAGQTSHEIELAKQRRVSEWLAKWTAELASAHSLCPEHHAPCDLPGYCASCYLAAAQSAIEDAS